MTPDEEERVAAWTTLLLAHRMLLEPDGGWAYLTRRLTHAPFEDDAGVWNRVGATMVGSTPGFADHLPKRLRNGNWGRTDDGCPPDDYNNPRSTVGLAPS